MIQKVQNDPNHFRFQFFYYNRARDAMHDAVRQLAKKGYMNIYIPGYIGWSPKEGSGIFDPLNSIPNLTRRYYVMDRQLHIDINDLQESLLDHSILLLVNYFGFRDNCFSEVVRIAHDRDCVVIEDNAHGFFTYFCNDPMGSDLTFFSLHKLFPFPIGGGLLLENPSLRINPVENLPKSFDQDPFSYNIHAIAQKRLSNYRILAQLVKGKEQYFIPLKNFEDLESNVPQTFPIIILEGNRNQIYEIMNAS